MKKVYLLMSIVIIFLSSFTSCTKNDSAFQENNVKENSSTSDTTSRENNTASRENNTISRENDTASQEYDVKEIFYQSGSNDKNYVELYKVNNNIWVHTTYSNYEGNRTPSNGIIAITSDGLILVDTPWNNEQTEELIKLTKSVFKKDIIIAIITHAHADRIGGIDTLLANKVDVRSTGLTAKESEKNGFKQPQPSLDEEPAFSVGDLDIEVFYPGEGHSVDNITVWFPQNKALFGGCLIKSADSTNIGSVTDANAQQWPDSVNKVIEKYPDAETVIPGHGNWGSLDIINHTLDLLS